MPLGGSGTANADAGANEELNVIAAVIGGAALSGGEGSVIGAAIGVFLIGIVEDAVILLDVSVYWQQLVVGVMLIIAVATNISDDKNPPQDQCAGCLEPNHWPRRREWDSGCRRATAASAGGDVTGALLSD